MREVQADPVREEVKKPLYIGRTGDNETMQVFFPVREWLDEYAGCEVHLSYGRPTEADQREVTAVEVIGDDLVWTVEDIDVEKAGTGVATVYMLLGEQVEKSAEYSVIVKKARPIGPTPTDAVKEWFLKILEAKGKGPRINEATGTWEVWDVDAQEWVDTEVHAEGTSPRIEVEDVEGGHQVTVYDVEHPDGQSFDVMDGEDAEVPIDDTEPAADKVYSSAKVEQVVGLVNQAKPNLPLEGTPVVGQLMRIKSINQDGTITFEWANGGVSGVTVNGSSVVGQDGVAVMPIAADASLGLVTPSQTFGITANQSAGGRLSIVKATLAEIQQHTNQYHPITPAIIIPATKVGMLAEDTAWTQDEQTTFQQKIGILSIEGVSY